MVTGGGQAELGRALGGYVNVVTQERHQRAARHALRLLPRRRLQRQERADRTRSCRWTSSSSAPASAGRSSRNRTFYFANVERKLLDQTGVVTHPRRERRGHQRPAGAGRLSGAAGRRPASIPNPVHSPNVLGKVDHQVSGADQLSVRYALYDVDLEQRARRRRVERAVGLDRPRQHRSVDRRRQRLDAVAEHRQRNAGPGRPRRPARRYSTDQIGPQVTIAGVATFGTFSSSPTRRENTMYQIVNNLSHRPARTRCAPASTSSTTTTRSPSCGRSAAATRFSSLANFLTGNYNGFAQTFGDPVDHPDESRTSASTCRTSGGPARG